MKLRKLISSSLAIGLLFNSVSPSLASILSEDGRYETFEGNNITIDNILEEDKVNVEIEGNTMVNVANQKDAVPITKSYIVEGTNHIPLQGEYDGKARPVIEGNTMYYNNDTGELTDTFVEEANLSLVSSFEDQLVTQEMVDSREEKPENLGKYKVEYKVSGKNKFDKWINGGINSDNGLDSTASKAFRTKFIPIDSTKSYFLSNLYDGCSSLVAYYDSNFNYIGRTQGNPVTFIELVGSAYNPSTSHGHYLPENCSYIRFTQYAVSGQNVTLEDIVNNTMNIQIEEGSTATEYEPYKESIKTLYLNSPLLEGDTIENIDGKATHIKRYKKIVLDGSDDEGWRDSLSINDNNGLYIAINSSIFTDTMVNRNAYCNNLKVIKGNQFQLTKPGQIAIQQTNTYSRYFYISTNYSTISEFRENLSKNPTIIIYELAEPIYETISEDSILIDSYKDGHLDLNSNISVNKVDFMPTTTNLNYLYPSTEYTVQFESDKTGKIDTVSLGNEELYTNYSVVKGVNRFNIITPSNISSTELILDGIGGNLSKLVVTEATNKSFDYFEGIQSVGQDDENGHNIEIVSNNEFLGMKNKNIELRTFATREGFNKFTLIGSQSWNSEAHFIVDANDIPLGTNIKIRLRVLENANPSANNSKTISWALTDFNVGDFDYTLINEWQEIEYITNKESTNTRQPLMLLGLKKTATSADRLVANVEVEINNSKQASKLEIPLSEPLRSLPSGDKDKIIKRNGQWVVERNLEEVILDGSDDEKYRTINDEFSDVKWFGFTLKNKQLGMGNSISNKFINSIAWDNIELLQDATNYTTWNCNTYISINKDKLLSIDIDGFKHWLKSNPVRIVYKLSEPTYEPLNISPTINLYLDTTHISNNSNVPANMKVTVDRTINRATEAIELAKENPTIENIALARMWTNLLKETINKDELHNQINNITQVVDLEIEKKSVSANVDVYVKSDNALSMTLSTNSIVFDNYSGVNDMEKLNAVEVTVHSSLPYDLNAYLESGISSTDNTTMDSNLLQIKQSENSTYQSFTNTTDKIILEEDCNSGNYNRHNIDLKIEGSNAYKADVYKTTIKFEAQQK